MLWNHELGLKFRPLLGIERKPKGDKVKVKLKSLRLHISDVACEQLVAHDSFDGVTNCKGIHITENWEDL